MSADGTMDWGDMQVDMQPVVPQSNLYSTDQDDDSSGNGYPPIEAKLSSGIEKQVKVIWIVVAVCGLLGGAVLSALIASGQPLTGPQAGGWAIGGTVVSIISLVLAGIGLICVPFASYYGRKFSEQLQLMKSGQYLAHWNYEHDQWDAFVKDEEKEASSITLTVMIVAGILAAVFSITLAGLIGVAACVFMFVGLLAGGYLLGKFIEWCQLKKLQRWRENPWFAVIGFQGLYYNGGYYPYTIFGGGLNSLKYDKTDSMNYLIFTFFTKTKDGTNYKERRIPVPFGKEAEAQKIVSMVS